MRAINYSDDFYSNVANNAESATIIARLVVDYVRPASVIDIGCGIGAWLKAFRELSVQDITGYDGFWVKEDQLVISKENFHRQDLERKLSFSRRYGLAVCLEVAEHLPPERAESFVRELTEASDVVLFSAAIPFQGGTNHLNEQWPEYWIERFRKEGYVVIDCMRERLWSKPEVRWFYAQNIMIYLKESRLQDFPALACAYERDNLWGMPMVHPRRWCKQIDPKMASLRNTLKLAFNISTQKL
jgi:hypothetical protein